MSAPGLTVTQHHGVDADATAEAGTATEIWAALTGSEAFHTALIAAVRDITADRTVSAVLDRLQEAGVTALHGRYASLIVRVAHGDTRGVYDFLQATRHLGTGRSSIDDIVAAAHLFALADDVVPTVTVTIPRAFRDERKSVRRDVCRVLAALARGVDVQLVATRLTHRWLLDAHRTDLPVSRDDITPRNSTRVEERAAHARATLDADSREVTVLRHVHDAAGRTLSYTALYNAFTVSRSRVRQCIARLSDLGLVETFTTPSGTHVELLAAANEFLTVLDEELGRQQRLSEVVTEPGKSSAQDRESSASTRPVPCDSTGTSSTADRYETTRLSQATHHAAAATAPRGGVALVEQASGPVTSDLDRRSRGVSYDPSREEAVVSVAATGPFQYVVSAATALTAPQFLSEALPASRLEAIDTPPVILRRARCIGAISGAELDDGDALQKALIEWGEHIEALTAKLNRSTVNDSHALRGRIMRLAHGLYGSIAHLLDVVDVTLVRDIRVASELGPKKDLQPLAKSIAISTAIQSRYENFAAYRQLYEPREEKRAAAFTPRVDAADPVGNLIGGLVLRGPDIHRLEPAVMTALQSPEAVHEDAPEIAVSVPIQTNTDRAMFAQTVHRMCDVKNFRATRYAVSVIEALAGSPYAAAAAIGRGIATSDRHRPIRVDDLRVALATLPAEHILPDAAPTVSRITAALLDVQRPVSQTDLATIADVSARSVRTHISTLVSLGIVRSVDGTYELTLVPPDQPHSNDLPVLASPSTEHNQHADFPDNAAESTARTAGTDATDGTEALTVDPPDADSPDALQRLNATRLTGLTSLAPQSILGDKHCTPTSGVVTFGRSLDQTSLHAYTDQPANAASTANGDQE